MAKKKYSPNFHCVNEAQKKAIRASYARKNSFTLYPRDKRHFRGHKDNVNGKIKYHPNYVFGETKDKYYSYGVTEEQKYDKKHNNYPLLENPNRTDKNNKYKKSYIHKKSRNDYKSNYSNMYSDYVLHPDDKKYIDDKIDKKYLTEKKDK